MNFPIENEQWRAVDGYDNYQVSSHGRVRNSKFSRILKPSSGTGGYYFVFLYKDGKKHGNGKYSWTDGSCYDGDWYENKIRGNVTIYIKRN